MAYFVACCQTIVAKLDKLLVRQGPTGVTGKGCLYFCSRGIGPLYWMALTTIMNSVINSITTSWS